MAGTLAERAMVLVWFGLPLLCLWCAFTFTTWAARGPNCHMEAVRAACVECQWYGEAKEIGVARPSPRGINGSWMCKQAVRPTPLLTAAAAVAACELAAAAAASSPHSPHSPLSPSAALPSHGAAGRRFVGGVARRAGCLAVGAALMLAGAGGVAAEPTGANSTAASEDPASAAHAARVAAADGCADVVLTVPAGIAATVRKTFEATGMHDVYTETAAGAGSTPAVRAAVVTLSPKACGGSAATGSAEDACGVDSDCIAVCEGLAKTPADAGTVEAFREPHHGTTDADLAKISERIAR